MSDAEEAGTDEPDDEGDEPIEEELEEELEELRAERDELAARVDDLEEEREELESRVKRVAADFENYKKRQEKQRERVAAEASERIIERLLDVRDNLQRAIDQSDADDVETLREGIKLTLAEFDRVLDAEDVVEITPEPGEEVDPQRHEVMMRIDGEQDAGRIEEVYQAGYQMGDRVIRAAQVAVSKPEESGDDAEDQ